MPDPYPEIPPSDPGSGTFESYPPPPAKGAVKSGVIWIAAGFGATQVLRFVSSIVLARLLYPEAFGLISLTFVFLTGLHLFSEIGLRVSIIQSPRGEEPDFVNTAWTLQVIRGFVLWAAACALAWPVAYLRPQPEPDLLWLLPLIGFAAVIEGFISTKLYGLYRHLQQKKAVLIDLISNAGGIAVTVAWAAVEAYRHPNPPDRSVLAMAAGPLACALIQVLLSHLLPGPRNRVRWERSSARDLVHFGRWIFLSTVFTYLADHTDRVVVSFFSMTVLGVYHLANQLATVPATLMGTVARQIILPLYSRLLDAKKDIHDALHLVQARAGAATALLIAGLIAVGPTLIRCMYDQRYEEATWILPMLAIVMMVQIFDTNGSSLLIALGKPRVYALSNAIKVLCLIAFMPLGAWLDDLRGLIAAMILGEIGRYLCTGIALRRNGLPIFRRDVAWATFALTVGFGVNYVVNLHGPKLPEVRVWPILLSRMALEASLVIGGWGVLVGIGWKVGWFRGRREVL